MKWISVKDRFPDEFQDVFLLCKSKGTEYYSIIVGSRSYYCPQSYYYSAKTSSEWAVKLFGETPVYLIMEEHCIHNPFRREEFFFGEVTHWMPLPEPPKELHLDDTYDPKIG